MTHSIKVYFAASEELLTKMCERAGSPGLDENRDYNYMVVEPHEDIIFYQSTQDALNNAFNRKLPYLYEAKFDINACITGLNCCLNNDVNSLEFLGKEIAKLNV